MDLELRPWNVFLEPFEWSRNLVNVRPVLSIFSVKFKKQTDGMIQFSTAHEHNLFWCP